MHQEHNIPWNTFVSNFEYVHEDRRFTPPRTGFVPLQRPTQAKELNYFTQKMISTIRDFSLTEREKYPPAQDLKTPNDGLLFSDQLREKYPEYLNSENQTIDYWIRSAFVDPNGTNFPRYTTSNGDLADVVKILIHENQMETLLMLANHPRVPLHSLEFLTWGHHFGFHRIVEAALIPYIYWNCMAGSNRLASGGYKNETYERIVRVVTQSMDHDAQQVPHRQFYGVKGPGKQEGNTPDVEVSRLREYLKHLFCLFYRYDIITRECQIDPSWEYEIVSSISWWYGIKHKTTDDNDGKRRFHF